jgi:peptidoglycan/xylan/chitin deacetylase (PgdA/CDA1 family)
VEEVRVNSGKVTIVNYHFVRDLNHSRYPEIKGLSLEAFRGQLEYLRRYYHFLRVEDLLEAAQGGATGLPTNAALLTFDDGYLDHFVTVFPLLDDCGIQGCFFPPAKAVLENEVLEVNKIHFILASVPDKTQLVHDIFSLLNEYRTAFSLKENDYYYQTFATANRFDTEAVIFIKRVLQKGLPKTLRGEITSRLFKKYVTEDGASFSRELYMSFDHLSCMKRHGMYIGSHGYAHCWLDALDREEQEKEIELSLNLLNSLGCSTDEWVISYPYGGFNESLLSLIKDKGCRVGFTTQADIADLSRGNPLTLSRLDTNDLPQDGRASPNAWTLAMNT